MKFRRLLLGVAVALVGCGGGDAPPFDPAVCGITVEGGNAFNVQRSKICLLNVPASICVRTNLLLQNIGPGYAGPTFTIPVTSIGIVEFHPGDCSGSVRDVQFSPTGA